MLRFLGRIYEFFWRPTTGRPWTYQIRDWTRHHPWRVWPIVALTTTCFVTGEILLPMYFGWKALPFILWTNFMGFVAGHLFWDTAGGYVKSVLEVAQEE